MVVVQCKFVILFSCVTLTPTLRDEHKLSYPQLASSQSKSFPLLEKLSLAENDSIFCCIKRIFSFFGLNYT